MGAALLPDGRGVRQTPVALRAAIMTKRQSNRPDRRFLPEDSLTTEQRDELARRISYAGSGNHKLRPGDYGFVPPANPRPTKSACDELRPIRKAEATRLLPSVPAW